MVNLDCNNFWWGGRLDCGSQSIRPLENSVSSSESSYGSFQMFFFFFFFAKCGNFFSFRLSAKRLIYRSSGAEWVMPDGQRPSRRVVVGATHLRHHRFLGCFRKGLATYFHFDVKINDEFE